jgi:tetratricopeptide (TPR) repeat protein
VAAAQRALALDSSLADGLEVMAAHELFFRWDLPAAKARIDAAVALYPEHPDLNNLLGTWLRWSGHLDESTSAKQEADSLDPLSQRWARQSALSLYLAHRCEEAAAAYRRLPPERRSTREVSNPLYVSLMCAGKPDEAAAELRTSLLLAGDSALARTLDPPLSVAQREAAVSNVFRGRVEVLLERRRRGWIPSDQIMFQYAVLGDRDATLAWLDSMYVERSKGIGWIPFDPLNDFLRGDPRFEALLRRLPWRSETE